MIPLLIFGAIAATAGTFLVLAAATWSVGRSILEADEA